MTKDERPVASRGGDVPGGDDARRKFSVGNDPAISTQVRMELLHTLNARTGFSAVEAQRQLETRDVRAEFTLNFSALGLAADNLPDLLAANFLVMWRIVNDVSSPEPEIAQALSRQFAGMIGASPEARDPAKRQAMGEALLYESMLSTDAYRAAVDAGDTEQIKRIAETAQANFLAQRSINLRKTRLGKSGMVRA